MIEYKDDIGINPAFIDIIPNQIAHDFWTKELVENNDVVTSGSGTSRILFEYQASKDKIDDNINTASGRYSKVGFSTDSEDRGYNVVGDFLAWNNSNGNPQTLVNLSSIFTKDGERLVNKWYVTPQMVRFNDDIIYLMYNNQGYTVVCSQKFGVIKTLDRIQYCGSRVVGNTTVSTLVSEKNSVKITLTDGTVYVIDKDYSITKLENDQKYTPNSFTNEKIPALFNQTGNTDSGVNRSFQYKLLCYDERTSTGIAVDNANDRVIVINYNSDNRADIISIPNGGVFSSEQQCDAYVNGDYFIIRDRNRFGISLFSIDRKNNKFELEYQFQPDGGITDDTVASLVIHDKDVFIPNGNSIYKIQLAPVKGVGRYDSVLCVKQLFEYDGVYFALSQDVMTDELNGTRLYDVTVVSLLQINYTEKKDYAMSVVDGDKPFASYGANTEIVIGYVGSDSFVGERNTIDAPMMLFPIAEYTTSEIVAVISTGESGEDPILKIKGGDFYYQIGSKPAVFLHSRLETVEGVPYLIKNGRKIRLDTLISEKDRRSVVSLGADVDTIKGSKNPNFITAQISMEGENDILSIISQTGGIVRDFENDTFYMVTKLMGCHYMVHDVYTDRKRIDIGVQNKKVSSLFKTIETDRYVINIDQDIDPKISMYIDKMRPSELNQLCSNIIADRFN